MWEGEVYTFNPKNGKIVTRAKDDEEHKLPSIKITKIKNGRVYLSYVDLKFKSALIINMVKNSRE